MKHIVAVDGGASRCRLAAFSPQGEQLARVALDAHASLSMGVDEAWSHIQGGLRSLRHQLAESAQWQPSVLSLGLAGALQEQKHARFVHLVPTDIRTVLHTDGYAQLVGATDGQPGICLAVGTGSVMHWLDKDGHNAMAGGWGFPVGDQGSGAWLGVRLLQRYIAHRDGRVCQSTLMEAVERRVGSSVSAIQQWTTQSRSSALAQLAPLVFEAAAAGDEVAAALVKEASDHCLELVKLAPTDLPVHIVGGVGSELLPTLAHLLGDRVLPCRGDALRGLWRLASAL